MLGFTSNFDFKKNWMFWFFFDKRKNMIFLAHKNQNNQKKNKK